MHDPMEGAAYWKGYNDGMNGMPWTRVVHHRFAPGTRAFHKYLEGSADGLKARHLIKHEHRH